MLSAMDEATAEIFLNNRGEKLRKQPEEILCHYKHGNEGYDGYRNTTNQGKKK